MLRTVLDRLAGLRIERQALATVPAARRGDDDCGCGGRGCPICMPW